MANLNKVLLIGNLTRDPELRYIPSGTAVANFGLAMNRVYTTQDGERKEETCFVDVETWGKTAENCANYLAKGRSVFIEGRLRFHSWETEDGQKRSKLNVVAFNVQFLGGPRTEGAPGAERMDELEADDDIPF
jgi:single-strand DNA-binding protein